MADSRINLIVSFIKSEAQAQAHAIKLAADSEADQKYNDVLNRRRDEIKLAMGKKLDAFNKTQHIRLADCVNASKMRILKTREAALNAMVDELRHRLARAMEDRETKRQLYKRLVWDALETLAEEKCVLKCFEADRELVSQVIAEMPGYSVVLTEEPLHSSGLHYGVVATNTEGTITVDNTLEKRIELATHSCIPVITGMLEVSVPMEVGDSSAPDIQPEPCCPDSSSDSDSF